MKCLIGSFEKVTERVAVAWQYGCKTGCRERTEEAAILILGISVGGTSSQVVEMQRSERREVFCGRIGSN